VLIAEDITKAITEIKESFEKYLNNEKYLKLRQTSKIN